MVIVRIIELISSNRVSYCKLDMESDRGRRETPVIFIPYSSKISDFLAIHNSLM